MFEMTAGAESIPVGYESRDGIIAWKVASNTVLGARILQRAAKLFMLTHLWENRAPTEQVAGHCC